MRKIFVCIALALLYCIAIASTDNASDMSWTKKVGATKFPSSQKIFNTADYGVGK